MSKYPRFSGTLVVAALVSLTSAAGAQVKLASAARLSPELEAARTALDKYQDPVVAVHDGYLSTLGCIEYPKGGSEGTMAYKPGGMGVHFLNMGNVGPTLSADKPQVLIYEPVGNKLQLVAAEWFVPVAAVQGDVPMIFGRKLDGPMMGHKPIMPDGLHHYDLHVWLWKDNPSGMFHSTNPTIKCPAGPYSFAEDATKMAHDHD